MILWPMWNDLILVRYSYITAEKGINRNSHKERRPPNRGHCYLGGVLQRGQCIYSSKGSSTARTNAIP